MRQKFRFDKVRTPLLLASWSALIEKDSTREIQDTTLLPAVAPDHEAVVRILVDMGANKNARDADGKTARQYASSASTKALLQ